jgi:hypothetical protein
MSNQKFFNSNFESIIFYKSFQKKFYGTFCLAGDFKLRIKHQKSTKYVFTVQHRVKKSPMRNIIVLENKQN